MASLWDMLSQHLDNTGQGLQNLWSQHIAPTVTPIASNFFQTLTSPETVTPALGGALGAIIGQSLSRRRDRGLGTGRGFLLGQQAFDAPFALKSALLQDQVKQGLMTMTPPTPGATPQTTLYGTPFYGVGTIKQRYPSQALPPFHGENFQQYGDELPPSWLRYPYTPPPQPSSEEVEAARIRGDMPATTSIMSGLEARLSQEAEAERRRQRGFLDVMKLFRGDVGGGTPGSSGNVTGGGVPSEVWRRNVTWDPGTGDVKLGMQEHPYSVKAFKPGYRMIGPNGEDLGVVPGGEGAGGTPKEQRANLLALYRGLGAHMGQIQKEKAGYVGGTVPPELLADEQETARHIMAVQAELENSAGLSIQPTANPAEEAVKQQRAQEYAQGIFNPTYIKLYAAQRGLNDPALTAAVERQLLDFYTEFEQSRQTLLGHLNKQFFGEPIPPGIRAQYLKDTISALAVRDYEQLNPSSPTVSAPDWLKKPAQTIQEYYDAYQKWLEQKAKDMGVR